MQVRSASKVGVLRAGAAFSVQVLQPIARGETILTVDGIRTATPSRLSVQVAMNEHIEVPDGLSIEEQMDAHPWRFLNHSCDPNAVFDGEHFVAWRAIAPGEQVTFDYDTTEYEISSPFECHCGSARCRGRRVRGYKHLSAADHERLKPMFAPMFARQLRSGLA